MRSGLAAGLAVALVLRGGAARADDSLDHDPIAALENPDKIERSFSQQIEERLTWLGGEVGSHLGNLSMNRVDFRFDGHERRARLGLGKGDGGLLSMRVGADVKFERGYARVATSINLTINGKNIQLELPKVELVPRSFAGEHYLEVRVPLIEGTFDPERWFRSH